MMHLVIAKGSRSFRYRFTTAKKIRFSLTNAATFKKNYFLRLCCLHSLAFPEKQDEQMRGTEQQQHYLPRSPHPLIELGH
jgi:hypothetical protein